MEATTVTVTEEPIAPQAKTTGLKLDLACGLSPKDGYQGVDLYGDKAAVKHDLGSYPWPFEDGAAIDVHCSHFIEHIPMIEVQAHGFERQDALFAFFDEIHRILEVGGTVSLCWPALKTVRAFQDPTHRRFIPAETLQYLDKTWRDQVGLSHYQVKCNFEIVSATFSMSMDLSTRHPEAQARMTRGEWDAILDYVAVLKKRP